jgi:hypothetical protein
MNFYVSCHYLTLILQLLQQPLFDPYTDDCSSKEAFSGFGECKLKVKIAYASFLYNCTFVILGACATGDMVSV